MSGEMSEQLQVWTNDCDYVVAWSAEDAERITAEAFPGYVGSADDWAPCVSDQPFTYHADGTRSSAGVTKTMAEWAAERGRGYFCTSEF